MLAKTLANCKQDQFVLLQDMVASGLEGNKLKIALQNSDTDTEETTALYI